MDTHLDDILSGEFQNRIARLLIQIMRRGYGRLEIQVEKRAIYWLRPAARIYNPLTPVYADVRAENLPDVLGDWAPTFALELQGILQSGWGRVLVGIDHGRIHYIESMPDIRGNDLVYFSGATV